MTTVLIALGFSRLEAATPVEVPPISNTHTTCVAPSLNYFLNPFRLLRTKSESKQGVVSDIPSSADSLAVNLGDIDERNKSKKTLFIGVVVVTSAVLIAGIIGWRIYAAITCNEEKDKCLDDCKSTYQTVLHFLNECSNHCYTVARKCNENFALRYRYTNSSFTPST